MEKAFTVIFNSLNEPVLKNNYETKFDKKVILVWNLLESIFVGELCTYRTIPFYKKDLKLRCQIFTNVYSNHFPCVDLVHIGKHPLTFKSKVKIWIISSDDCASQFPFVNYVHIGHHPFTRKFNVKIWNIFTDVCSSRLCNYWLSLRNLNM